MARLPIPGSDTGTWGDILNEFLQVEHNGDGTLKSTGIIGAKADDVSVVHNVGNETINGIKTFAASPVIPGPTAANQAATKGYVDANAAQVQSVAGKTGAVTLTASDVANALAGAVSPTPIVAPSVNDLWYDSANDQWNRWNGTVWVKAGSKTYATMPNGGQKIFTSSTDPGNQAAEGDIWLAP